MEQQQQHQYDLNNVRVEPESEDSFHTNEEYGTYSPEPVIIDISSDMSQLNIGGESDGEPSDQPEPEFERERRNAQNEGWGEDDFFYRDEEPAFGTRTFRAHGRTVSWRSRAEFFESRAERIGVLYSRIVVRHNMSDQTTMCRRTQFDEEEWGRDDVRVDFPSSPERDTDEESVVVVEVGEPTSAEPRIPADEERETDEDSVMVVEEEPLAPEVPPIPEHPDHIPDRPEAGQLEDTIDLCVSSDDELLGREEPAVPRLEPPPQLEVTEPREETWPHEVQVEVDRLWREASLLPHRINVIVKVGIQRYRISANPTGEVRVRRLPDGEPANPRDPRRRGRDRSRSRSGSNHRGGRTRRRPSPLDLDASWERMPPDYGTHICSDTTVATLTAIVLL